MGKSSLQQLRKALTKAHSHQPLRPTAAALAVATCFSASLALANPTGGVVVNGAVVGGPNIPGAGNILNIQTLTANTIINWGSFSIQLGELTKFIQPSALSAVLNRVTGQDPSAILGALQSNGRVFLVNPNGIVFGAGAQIDVAGLVASTLNLSDDDFRNNRMRFTDGAGAGSVVNQGNISSGSVYLVGNAVTNDGLITSPNGEVILAAGNSVELVNPGTPNLRVEVVATDHTARNLGTITADAGRIGIYAGLISNSGTLNASSAVAEGGRIMLKATQSTTLAATSILDASGAGGGRIDVLADDTVHVDGRLDASAPSGGNGGFIETSGKNRVKIAPSSVITTNAPYGKTGTWLIDPTDFVISSSYGGDAYGSTIATNLASSNVIITSDQGAGGVNGDILVNDSISWTASNSLTLLAKRNIEINSLIDGGGDVSLYAGWNGASEAAPAVTNGVGDITATGCCSTVQTRGNIFFEAGRDIILPSIQVLAGVNSFGLATDAAPKSVQLTAGNSINLFGVDGPTVVNATGNSGSAATVRLEAKSGSVTVQDSSQVLAYGGAEGGEGGGVGGAATVTVIAGNGINVISSGSIAAYGGSGSGAKGGAAAVSLSAVGGSIQIDGAEGATAQGGAGTTTGNATISLVSAGDIVVKQNNSISPQLKAKANSGDSPGTALVLLAAAGNVNLNSATIDSTGGVGLGGANIALNNGTISAGGGVIFTAKSNLDVVNNSNVTGSGILNIGAGGNVLVDQSKLSGSPDVVMTVGGTVRINGTLATPGSISAVSSQTIYLTFPTGLGGGFYINGIEGVVYDSATNTGFFAGGSPAVLGTNFLVTYGGISSLTAPTDALIVAMGESGKPPDPNKDKDVFKDAEDEEKDAPVCR